MRQINSNENSRAEVNRLAPSRAGHPFGRVCAWRRWVESLAFTGPGARRLMPAYVQTGYVAGLPV